MTREEATKLLIEVAKVFANRAPLELMDALDDNLGSRAAKIVAITQAINVLS